MEQVCEQLAGIPELADGFNAIGFSQVRSSSCSECKGKRSRCSSLFAREDCFLGKEEIMIYIYYKQQGIHINNQCSTSSRAYVERCNRPAVHRLITFGSPHGGKNRILGQV